MATAQSLVAPIGAEYQLRSPLGRAIQKITLTATQQKRVSAVKAAGGQIALSSPLGRYLLRVAKDKDAGSFVASKERTLLAAVGSEEQLSSPLGQFSVRLK